MRYLIRRHSLLLTFAPSISPPHLIAPSASRPASRRTVSPDGSAQGTTPSYPLLARSSCLLTHLVPSHRLISSAHPFHPLLACLIRRTPSLLVIRSMLLIHLICSAASHRLIFRPALLPALLPAGRPASPTCPPHPSHPSHPLRSISLAHLPAPSDETSDEQTKRRTGRAIDNEEAERHDIRRLPDTANTPPRPPYSPYEPHNARTPTRTRPQENAPYMPLTTSLTGNTRR